MIKKPIEECRSRKLAYDSVINSNVNEDKYKGEHYKAIVYFKKRKADKAVPLLLRHLKERYKEIKGRKILHCHSFSPTDVWIKITSQRNSSVDLLERCYCQLRDWKKN